jgi:predicted dehydrogenase
VRGVASLDRAATLTGFGILGAGMVAEYHRAAIAANAEIGAQLVAVASGRDEQELLERADVDVVCVCTPSGLHAEQTIRAAEAGKHVLVEKPFALTLESADAVIEAAAANGVRVGVVLQRRADPAYSSAVQAVSNGDFGPVTLATLTIPYHRPQSYYDQAAWRGTWDLDGGGVLMNQGIHLLDILVWCLGDPVELDARYATLARSIEVEDTLVAALRFASGALATVAATTTASPGGPHRLEMFGTEGFVRIEGEAITAWESPRSVAPVTSAPVSRGAGGDPRGIEPDGHIRIVRDFVEALRDDRPPLVGGAEARRSLAAALAIYESARAAAPPRSRPGC